MLSIALYASIFIRDTMLTLKRSPEEWHFSRKDNIFLSDDALMMPSDDNYWTLNNRKPSGVNLCPINSLLSSFLACVCSVNSVPIYCYF